MSLSISSGMYHEDQSLSLAEYDPALDTLAPEINFADEVLWEKMAHDEIVEYMEYIFEGRTNYCRCLKDAEGWDVRDEYWEVDDGVMVDGNRVR